MDEIQTQFWKKYDDKENEIFQMNAMHDLNHTLTKR